MILAAFDLATVTGVCVGAVGERPRLFSWRLEGSDRPHRLLDFSYRLCEFLDRERPTRRVVYEAPMNVAIMARIGARDGTITMLRSLVGILEMSCAEFGLPVEALEVKDARQSVLGWRVNPSGNTKKRVLREANLLFKAGATNDNEADAMVLWMYACYLQNPQFAIEQIPLFKKVS